jgi:serine phosphatase RsbU (regulator of sigma subunit)
LKYLTLLIFFSINIFASNIDSLNCVLKKNISTKERVKTLSALSKSLLNTNPEKAVNIGKQALSLAIVNLDSIQIASCALNNAQAYFLMGNYSEGLSNAYLALSIYQKNKNQLGLANTYNTIGILFSEGLAEYNEAIEYYKKAQVIFKSLKRENDEAACLLNIGICFNNLNNDIDAQSYFLKAKEKYEGKDKYNFAFCLDNLGSLMLKKDSLNMAESYFEQAYKIYLETKDEIGIIGYNLNKAEILRKRGKLKEAEILFIKELKLAKQIDPQYARYSYEGLSEIYAATKDFQKAYNYHVLFKNINDSNINTQRQQQYQIIQSYTKSQSEAQVNQLNKDKEHQQEIIKQQRNLQIAFGVGLLLMILLASFIYRSYKQKQKSNVELETKNKLIEHQKAETTKSIEYALHIQQSILPDKEHIYDCFPESFVLYKPKDIVSGDFYAFAQQGSEIIIAAADCTGHGVPGALMSMLGSNILYQIINEKKITKPNEILFHLNLGVAESLKQNKNAGNDGMDISICNFKNNVLQYAGAYRPLYIIRQGKLIETKATKIAIGGQQKDQQRIYENHEFELQNGDTIYLTTDGYADQFGGDKNKKLTTTKFKEMLLNIQNMTMQEQEIYLADFIEKWRSANEQVDDICVIGIRI